MTENFFSESFDTPTGRMRIITDAEQRLRAVDWENKGDRLLQWLRSHYGENGFRLGETPAPSAPRLALEAYFEGQVAAIEAIRTQARGTEDRPSGGRSCRRRCERSEPHTHRRSLS
jgi:methylated-DNA-[protein]-cysteine S-methyltransferase